MSRAAVRWDNGRKYMVWRLSCLWWGERYIFSVDKDYIFVFNILDSKLCPLAFHIATLFIKCLFVVFLFTDRFPTPLSYVVYVFRRKKIVALRVFSFFQRTELLDRAEDHGELCSVPVAWSPPEVVSYFFGARFTMGKGGIMQSNPFPYAIRCNCRNYVPCLPHRWLCYCHSSCKQKIFSSLGRLGTNSDVSASSGASFWWLMAWANRFCDCIYTYEFNRYLWVVTHCFDYILWILMRFIWLRFFKFSVQIFGRV